MNIQIHDYHVWLSVINLLLAHWLESESKLDENLTEIFERVCNRRALLKSPP